MIYSLDTLVPTKQQRAKAWLTRLLDSDILVLSPQVLTETYWAVSRKKSLEHARPTVRALLARSQRWVTAPLDGDVVMRGLWIEERYRIQFWDALLVASANAAACDFFLSEDLNDGQDYGPSRVINPFRHTPEDVLGPPLPA